MFPKFKLKKDWFIQTDILGIKNKTLIFPEGHIFEPTQNGEYHIIQGGWSESTPNIGSRMILSQDDMRLGNDNGDLLFEELEVKKDIEVLIQEVPDDDDTLVKNWRIQLDVKTTRKKLKDIESIIKDRVLPLL